MDSTTTEAPQSRSTNPTGQRLETPAHRRALERAETARERGGLPVDTSPWALLDALDELCDHTEWNTNLVRTLRLLIRPIPMRDWHRGRPVNYRPASDLADELGISDRAFRYRVNRLMELGAVAFRDAPNCHRYRTPTDEGGEGDVFGIDLAPCILLLDEARARAGELRAERNALKRLRHRASALRSRVRAFLRDPGSRHTLGDAAAALDADLATLDPGRLDRLARAALDTLIVRFSALLGRCRALLEAVTGAGESLVENALGESSHDSDSFRPSGSELPPMTTLQSSSVPPNSCSPPDHVPNNASPPASVAQLVEALPAPLARILPPDKRIEGTVAIDDLVTACRMFRPRLGISAQAWGEAERMIGAARSSVVLVITAARSAEDWPEDRRVYNPGGFFRALSRRVARGSADLRGSVHGIVARNLAPRRTGDFARGRP